MAIQYSQVFFGGKSLSDLASLAADVVENGTTEFDAESSPTGWKYQDFELNELASADCSACTQNSCKQRFWVHLTSRQWTIEHEVP